jgi:predicted DNA-binding transcriptional regulator AlpA
LTNSSLLLHIPTINPPSIAGWCQWSIAYETAHFPNAYIPAGYRIRQVETDFSIPVGRSTWWAGVKSGAFPRPRKLGRRITAWKVEDIRSLIEHGIDGEH